MNAKGRERRRKHKARVALVLSLVPSSLDLDPSTLDAIALDLSALSVDDKVGIALVLDAWVAKVKADRAKTIAPAKASARAKVKRKARVRHKVKGIYSPLSPDTFERTRERQLARAIALQASCGAMPSLDLAANPKDARELR